MAVTGVNPSNCLEYLLFADGVGIALAELRGFGEPVDVGVNVSRPAKESYNYQYGAAGCYPSTNSLYSSSFDWHRLSSSVS